MCRLFNKALISEILKQKVLSIIAIKKSYQRQLQLFYMSYCLTNIFSGVFISEEEKKICDAFMNLTKVDDLENVQIN